MNGYILLAGAVAFELIAASVTTSSKGFTVLKPTLICLGAYAVSFYFFGLSLESINLGIGYATWGAAGTVVTSIVGYLFYKQKITKVGVFALVLITISIITLNLFG